MVDDEEELISKIRKEFGIKDTIKKNYIEVETSRTPYYEAPNPQVPQQPEKLLRKQSMVKFDGDELSDMTRKDIEDTLGGIIEEATKSQVPQQPERLLRKQSMVKLEFEDNELSDMTRNDIEDLLGAIIEEATKPAVGLTMSNISIR